MFFRMFQLILTDLNIFYTYLIMNHIHACIYLYSMCPLSLNMSDADRLLRDTEFIDLGSQLDLSGLCPGLNSVPGLRRDQLKSPQFLCKLVP